MSEDLISRQAAINAINSWFEIAKHPMNRGAYNNGELAAYSTAISEIENLPSAETFSYGHENDWIPVSERLPEENQMCLVCDKGCIGIDTYLGHGGIFEWKFYVKNYDAWMPLPKPLEGW